METIAEADSNRMVAEIVELDKAEAERMQLTAQNCLVRDSDTATTFMGAFVKGRAHGHGTRTFMNGGKYVGGWKFGRAHGYGVFEEDSVVVYRGEFR